MGRQHASRGIGDEIDVDLEMVVDASGCSRPFPVLGRIESDVGRMFVSDAVPAMVPLTIILILMERVMAEGGEERVPWS